MKALCLALVLAGCVSLAAAAYGPVVQDTLLFNTGDSDYRLASVSRPEGNGQPEIESADDFALAPPASITGMSFQGLVSSNLWQGYDYSQAATYIQQHIQQVDVQMYLVFPKKSNETVDNRLIANSPTNETDKVVARLNSPSDDVLFERTDVTYQLTTLNPNAYVPAYITDSQIQPKPNQQQPVSGFSGTAVEFSVKFDAMPFPENGHWFAVPQVLFNDPQYSFYWLSAPKPLTSGPAFPAGVNDLQSWIRNDVLDPDWERIGTDIVGNGAQYNAAFKIYGSYTASTPSSPPPQSYGRKFL